jgi:hypothetical protein
MIVDVDFETNKSIEVVLERKCVFRHTNKKSAIGCQTNKQIAFYSSSVTLKLLLRSRFKITKKSQANKIN